MENEKPDYANFTKKQIEELAREYRTYPNKKGRPPKVLAKAIASINRRERRIKITKTPEGKKKVTVQTPDKLEAFIEAFIKNGGNATEAALIVSPETTVINAASLGAYYMKKAKALGRIVMEKKGFHYGKMLDVAIDKMDKGKTPEWWDRLMRISGYEDFEQKKNTGPAVVNIVGTMKQDASEFGFEEGEIVNEEE